MVTPSLYNIEDLMSCCQRKCEERSVRLATIRYNFIARQSASNL